jgi:TPR repeat protein
MGNIVSVDLSVQPNWCNKQGYDLLSIVRLPLDMTISLPNSYVMRQRVLCCGLKSKLAWRLSLDMDVGLGFEKQSNSHACCRMTRSIVRCVASKLMTVVRAKEAEELCALGKCAAAQVPLQLAIYLGHLPSRALKAWMLLNGREGVAQDCKGAFELVEEGARLGCHHCQGVMACCYRDGYGIRRDFARSLELARESSGRGSRYGQWALGVFYLHGGAGVAHDINQALALFRLAAAQNLDEAQCELGCMYDEGDGVAQDYAEALRWYQLAAAQGHSIAMFNIACCYDDGHGVRRDHAEAISWYMRAQAAGSPYAADTLRWLGA